MPEQIMMTKYQYDVLNRLSGVADGLIGREFADIATVTIGRLDWGNAVLEALGVKGLVQKTEKRRQGVSIWVITEAGRSALQAMKEKYVPDTTDAPISDVTKFYISPVGAPLRYPTKFYLRSVVASHPWPQGRRTGHPAHDFLERRGLIEIKMADGEWREVRLTKKGIDVVNELFGISLTQPENLEEYEFDNGDDL